jgi:hypothetical protein
MPGDTDPPAMGRCRPVDDKHAGACRAGRTRPRTLSRIGRSPLWPKQRRHLRAAISDNVCTKRIAVTTGRGRAHNFLHGSWDGRTATVTPVSRSWCRGRKAELFGERRLPRSIIPR